MQKSRKRVTWKKGEKPIKQQLLPFFPDIDMQQNMQQINDLMGGAQLGAMFTVISNLGKMPDFHGRSLPPHSYLINEEFQYGVGYPKVANAGDLIVYMGEIRVAEGRSIKSVRQMVRHKFLIHGVIFIIYHLEAIAPVMSLS